MHVMLTTPLLASVIHGTAVPILWVIGIILIVAGVVALFRRSLILGVVMIAVAASTSSDRPRDWATRLSSVAVAEIIPLGSKIATGVRVAR